MDDQEDLGAAQFLRIEAQDEYEETVSKLHHYLAECNMHLLFVQRLESFNRRLFGFDLNGDFWQSTLNAHFYMCILRLSALIIEDRDDSLCLEALRKKIDHNCVSQKMRDEFNARLGPDFGKWTSDKRKRLKVLRDKFIAHINIDYHHIARFDLTVEAPTEKIVPISSAELREIVREAEVFWRKMCFNVFRDLQTWHYPQSPDFPTGDSDIEQALDIVALHSAVVRMPEEQPDFWPQHRERFSEKELAEINRIRQKGGLPEA